MNDQNSLLVDYRLVPVGPQCPPYEAHMTWAEPSEEHAAGLMRQLFNDRSFAKKLGASGKADLQLNLSIATAGRRMRERLEAITEEQKLVRRMRDRLEPIIEKEKQITLSRLRLSEELFI